MNYSNTAAIFKAFCDESRLKILEQLQKSEQCACNILDTLTIGQSTLSHHMKILVDSGIVKQRKEGKWVYYSISEDGASEAMKLLDKITRLDDNYSEDCGCE